MRRQPPRGSSGALHIWGLHARDHPLMTPHDLADRLEHFARRVRSIRPADHRNPHAFVEDKSEVVGELMAEARELRTVVVLPVARPTIRPGIRMIGRRQVAVEARRRVG